MRYGMKNQHEIHILHSRFLSRLLCRLQPLAQGCRVVQPMPFQLGTFEECLSAA